jgi:hypothetical protein
MKVKSSIILLIILFWMTFLGCKNHLDKSTIKDFKSFVSVIPAIELPFSTSCESCCDRVNLNIDSSFIEKINLDGLEVVGKIIVYEKYIGILYAGGGDYYAPALIIYDNYGTKISEKSFMGNYCGKSLDFYGKYYFDIDNQLHITETDTTMTFNLDSINFKIIDTLKTDITISNYLITDNGIIIKK